jgi:hypothetical protein
MIIECHACEAKVDANLVAQHSSEDQSDPVPFHVYLLECPRCHTTLVGGEYEFDEGGAPARLWPKPEKVLSWDIPETIRNSLEEARLCFKTGAYNASTVMAGRALEGVCRHFGTEQTYLGPGIRQLREKGIIDTRLGRWAEELQRARNLSAHASGEKVNKEDARDLLDFVGAICEYVFVLTKRFDEFMGRRAEITGDPAVLSGVRDTDLDAPEET